MNDQPSDVWAAIHNIKEHLESLDRRLDDNITPRLDDIEVFLGSEADIWQGRDRHAPRPRPD